VEQFINGDAPFDTPITLRMKLHYIWNVKLFEDFTEKYELEPPPPHKKKVKGEKVYLGHYLNEEAKSVKHENNNYYSLQIAKSQVLECRNGQIGPRSGNRNVAEELLKEFHAAAWLMPDGKGGALKSIDKMPTSPSAPLSSIGGVNYYAVLLHGSYTQFAYPTVNISSVMRYKVGTETELRLEDAEDAAGGGRKAQRAEKLKRMKQRLQSPAPSETVSQSSAFSPMMVLDDTKRLQLMCQFGGEADKALALRLLREHFAKKQAPTTTDGAEGVELSEDEE